MDLASSKTNNQDDSQDETPLFDKPPFLATVPSDLETDDDDDDDLGSSSFADNQYSNMNISEHLKNILGMDRTGNSSKMEVNWDDESDSDVDYPMSAQDMEAGIDMDKLNALIDKNRFANFPLPPPTEEQEKEQEDTAKKTKKPKEKKKRRDKGKKKATIDDDILFEADQAVKSKKLDSLFKRFAQDSESSEDDESSNNKKKKDKKASGRKTRKKVSHEIKLDENGEQMMRTTDILDASSSESSSEDERKLTKKQEMEMYRESERQRRTAKVVLKPVYNYKSFDELAKRREEREHQVQHQEKVITHNAPSQTFTPPRPTATSRSLFNMELEGIDDDSDSDIEITGVPQKIARAAQAAMLSPERARVPVAISPVRHASTALRNHNRHMLYRITNEGYDYRVKMEQAAKARGQYASATERARRLIEKEKNAMMINSQIERHFDKKKALNTHNTDDDDDEEDGDYQDQEGKKPYNDDILDDLSGSEEEFLVEEAVETPNRIQKRKMMSDEGPHADPEEQQEEENGDDDEEQDMAAMAFKRWKGKKVKKSTFFDDDDDDDEEAEQVSKKKKVAAKPVPAHSISNFFKAKENEAAEQAAERDETKTLSRLVRREHRDVSEEPPTATKAQEEDAMDIDRPLLVEKKKKEKPTMPTVIPRGPREKVEYLEEEAEEEDDEFFGAGGSDGETGENLDEFEKDDLLVEDSNEHIDEAALREAFNLQDKETDSNMIQRLITDITSGNLRKQKAALEAGLMLDDIDLYDEEDNDLVAIRRAAAARRRRLLKKKGGDILENLMSNPKTAAFAKAAQAVSDEMAIAVFSESEGEEDAEDAEGEADANKKNDSGDSDGYERSTPSVYTKRVIVEEDEEDEDEEQDQEMKDVSDDDENLLIVVSNTIFCMRDMYTEQQREQDEFDTMASSPLRGTTTVAGGLASSIHITSADDDDVDFQIENMQSPISVRKAKPLYGSPSTLERFKRLIAETNNALNGTSSDTGGPRVGFGSMQSKQQQQQQQQQGGRGESDGKPKLTGSLGEIFSKSNAKESKLKKLKAQSSHSSLFKYAE
ncbi:hypothetical protein MBANPS3_006211 [Mucor bainieri]